MNRLLLFILNVFCFGSAALLALDPSYYAQNSALSSGKWVKISVTSSGMHLLSKQQLQNLGFSNPDNVRIHGYGGEMLSDVLDPDLYIDDLPQVPSELTSRGLVFYAVGPSQITCDSNGILAHAVNPYSTKGYYFLTENAATKRLEPNPLQAANTNATAATLAATLLVHERELTSPGGSGRMMLGEDFSTTRSREFTFKLTNRVPNTPIGVACSFVARTPSPSIVEISLNGTKQPSSPSDRIPATTGGVAYWGQQVLMRRNSSENPANDNLIVKLDYNPSGLVDKANLDYLEVSYTANILPGAELFSSESTLALAPGAPANTRVWDITNPLNINAITPSANQAWKASSGGVRRYIAWAPDASLPSPKNEGNVKAQDLHALSAVPDMVIICPGIYRQPAENLAEIHRNNTYDPISVEVVDQNQIFNEFGSGAPDPGAIRRFLKMLYDRGTHAGTPLRFALMLGKGSCDNRQLTLMGRGINSPMPLWVSEASLQDNSSFSSDDYFALLDDFDGRRPALEKLDIALGRIPCTNIDEANIAVDKIKRYIYTIPRDEWLTRFTLLADDGNEGVHMFQSEALLNNLAKTKKGEQYVVQKVYCDAYSFEGSTYPQAKQDLFNYIQEGTMLFGFIGHGSPTALGSKIIIGPTDFRNKFYLRRPPFFYAATCDFLKWDHDFASMAEVLMFQPDGGMIGCISALRPVFITHNGSLSASFGTALSSLAPDGRELTFGELYQRAKNGVNNDVNKMRYVFMGDPAIRMGAPGNNIKLRTINGKQADDHQNPIEIKARQIITLKGEVCNLDGSTMTDFNGQLNIALYDAEYSTTSRAWGEEGKHVTFEQIGQKLLSAAAPVTAGEFEVTVRMPSAIADNYRPATLSLYASSTTKGDMRHAMGISRNIYAYGYDIDAPIDSIAPQILNLGLNEINSSNGVKVDNTPLLLASLSDDEALNISSAGVGTLMALIIDGKQFYGDLNRFFNLNTDDDTPGMSGSLSYRLPYLEAGNHTLTLRVWDVGNNPVERTLNFTVVDGLQPDIADVKASVSTATNQVKFTVNHNRPDAILTTRITVSNLNGETIWTTEKESRSNMNNSEAVTWNLCDGAGCRVQRGIYVYRAEISTDKGETFVTTGRKLAITAKEL